MIILNDKDRVNNNIHREYNFQNYKLYIILQVVAHSFLELFGTFAFLYFFAYEPDMSLCWKDLDRKQKSV